MRIDTVRKSPDVAVAHNNLGLAYKAEGRFDMITEYQTALRLRPNYANAHFNLGTAYLCAANMAKY